MTGQNAAQAGLSARLAEYLCPACRRPVLRADDAYNCPVCGRSYPIIYAIPDFRLTSDAYLDLESERAKSRDLAAHAERLSFSELVDYYYSITDDVPATLAAGYKRSISNGPAQLAELARDMDEGVDGPILDVGCGSGSLLLALAARGRPAVGVDIALRWLVICRKRLMERGLDRTLLCADILQHPFRERSASGIALIDVVEHTRDMQSAIERIAGLLAPGGRAWLTVSNRYTIGPHPSTRLWGIGYLPKRLAGGVSRLLRGVDSLRHVQLTTPRRIAKLLRQAGFATVSVRPRRITAAVRSVYPRHERVLIALYLCLLRWSLGRHLLVWIGPLSEIEATAPAMLEDRFA